MSDTTIADQGFKIYLTLLLWSDAKFRKKLRAVVKKAGVEPWDPELHPAVHEFLSNYVLDESWLASKVSIGWPDTDAVVAVIPGWDGEGAPYDIRSWAGLAQLPNLEELQWPQQGELPVDTFPDIASLTTVKIPTSYWSKRGSKKNTKAFEMFQARGFSIVDQQAHGMTTLTR